MILEVLVNLMVVQALIMLAIHVIIQLGSPVMVLHMISHRKGLLEACPLNHK